MSRIGIQPVEVPDSVDVSIQGNTIEIRGSKGELSYDFHPELSVEVDESAGEINVENPHEGNRQLNSIHGTTRSLIENMVEGVSEGYKKELRIKGTGYKADMKGDTLVLAVGFSEDVEKDVPDGLDVEVPNEQSIVIEGADKQVVGQFAAEVRKVRPPEPYNQKGIRYKGENIRQKEGKKFVSGV